LTLAALAITVIVMLILGLLCAFSCCLLSAKRKRRLKQYSTELSEQGVDIQDDTA
jgi:hypothetical protein